MTFLSPHEWNPQRKEKEEVPPVHNLRKSALEIEKKKERKKEKKKRKEKKKMPKRSEEMLAELWTSLLLVWITCVPYTSMTPIIGQSKSLQIAGSTATSLGLVEGQRILSRAKRGWVWNQMFVLEEFSGPDPILVGRVSTVIVSCILSLLIMWKH